MNIPAMPAEILLIKDEQLKQALTSMWNNLSKSINGGLYFGSTQEQAKGLLGNMNGLWPGTMAGGYAITTPGVANTAFTVTHNLGRIPIGYDVKSIDAAAHIYDSNKAGWTKTQMTLKCDVATVHLVLFVH